MPAFPTILLLATAAWIAVLRSRRPLWPLLAGGVGAGGALMLLLLAEAQLPLQAELSVWRPASLFGQGLLLILDDTAWGPALMVCGLVLAVVLSRVGDTDPTSIDIPYAFALAACALMGVLAGNMLSLIIAWSLMGACRLAWWIAAGAQQPAPERLLIRLAGQEISAPLLLLLADYANQSAAGLAEPFSPLRSVPGALLFMLAVLARSAPLNTQTAPADSAALTRPGHAAFAVLPPAAALAALGRADLTAIPAAAAGAGQWLGLLAFAAAAYGWAVLVRPEDAPAWLAWAVAGLGVMLTGAQVAPAVAALAVLVVLLGGLQCITRIEQPWQRLWPALAFLAVVGMPATPGAGIAGALATRLISGEVRLAGLFVPVGLALLGAGVLQEALRPGRVGDGSAGSWVRGSDLAGLVLVLLASGISLREKWVGGGFALILAAVCAAVGLGLGWVGSNWSGNLPEGYDGWPGADRLIRALRAIAATGLQAVRSLAALFEGRAGLLWMFLVLLAAWLAAQA